MRRQADALSVKSDVTTRTSVGDAIPASLWNAKLTERSQLLNTLDGTEMNVTIEDRGVERVSVGGDTVDARHYVISGDLKREVWYDTTGVLVKVRFRADDDSEIQYVLK